MTAVQHPPIAPDCYDAWADAALADRPLDHDDALAILRGDGIDLLALVHAAGRVRRHHFGRDVAIHVLDNVRNGACPEDCGYCGQSSGSSAPIQPYKLKSVDEIVADAQAAQQRGAYRFCMALSGRGPSDRDIDHICRAIEQIKARGIRTCLSAGLLDEAKAQKLKAAGLDRLNHNLNTAPGHYAEVCTTHTFDDRVRTLEAARTAGIGLCSGMIVGMGESDEDTLEVAYSLRRLGIESIPVNFLLPIDGNRVHEPESGGHALDPQFVLRVLCVMRLINPRAEVRIAAGREFHLRSLQPLSLWPANSLFMEGYLLTVGQEAQGTIRMIVDAGFRPVLEQPDAVPESLRNLITDHTAPPATTLKPSVARRVRLPQVS